MWVGVVAAAALMLGACRTTKPGTHVEVVEKGGNKVYVSGAAGPGTNKSIACRGAVSRAAAAIALRFAQDFDDVGDQVAEEVGAADGEVFLQGYAKEQVIDAAVQDITFDPVEHLCMATVRWTPPVFVKDAVSKYAHRLRAEELAAAEGPAASAQAPAAAAPADPAPAAAPAAPSTPPPAAASVASPAPAPAPPPHPACSRQRANLTQVLAQSQKSLDEFQECMRRTQNDETICHRYKLYVEDAQKKEAEAGRSLTSCLNEGLSSKIRLALSQNLPGHAAVSVESREDGSLILWTFSPVDQTAYAFELGADGTMVGKSPLAANQVQWVREQLGLE